MSKKKDLAKEIHMLEEEIKLLEIKRSRSMAGLMEAFISHTEPDEDDVRYFRAFTADIEVKRTRLHECTKELEGLI